MKEKQYFYFCNPHTFTYSAYVSLLFKKGKNRNGIYTNVINHSVWKEIEGYYYGEPVKCLIPFDRMDFEMLYNLFINSKNKDNVFGSINYMINEYHDLFLHSLKCCKEGENHDILYRYFIYIFQ